MIRKIGNWIVIFLAKLEGNNPSFNKYVENCEKILEEGYTISDNERYFHILHKIIIQFQKDRDYIRVVEDITSWIEETPCEDTRSALIELKSRFEGSYCEG